MLGGFLGVRLKHINTVLTGRERLAGHSTYRDYVAHATARPPSAKAHADQMAHFAAAD